MLCIICALDIEYNNIKKMFTNTAGRIGETEYHDSQIIILKSFVGKENAERCIEYILKKYSTITYVISAGIAGALSPYLAINDIVCANEIIDFRDNENYVIYTSDFACNSGIDVMSSLQKSIIKYDNHVTIYSGVVLSSNEIIWNQDLKRQLYKKHNALCVEMESAGIINICNNNYIPFHAIKIISDYADGKDNLSGVALLRKSYRATELLGKVLYDLYNDYIHI